MVFRKPADYSKAAIYKCKPAVYSKVAVYKCNLVVYSKVVVYKCKLAVYSKVAVYKCKPAVYTCKVAVYSCKVLKHNLPNFFLKKFGCVETYIPIFLLHNHFDTSKKLHLNTIQTIELHISFQLYQKYLFESTVLFTQYIQIPIHPLNTIYQIIYFNILWVCWLLVYTCKPLLYTKKLKERCYLYNVQHL